MVPRGIFNRPFQFEVAWVSHINFRQFVKDHCKASMPIEDNPSSLTSDIKKWNRDVIGNIFKRKKNIFARINCIQRSRHYGKNPF